MTHTPTDPAVDQAMRRALALVRAHATGDEAAAAVVLTGLRHPSDAASLMAALAGLPVLAVAQRPHDVVAWCDSLMTSLS